MKHTDFLCLAYIHIQAQVNEGNDIALFFTYITSVNRQVKRVLYLYPPPTHPSQWGALLPQEVLRVERGQPVMSGHIGDQSPHQLIFHSRMCHADYICNSRTGEREVEVKYVGYTVTGKREGEKNSKG